MKEVLLSVNPEWVEKIASGKKTIEVRKTRPKIETPFKCYIYETKGRQVEHCDGCDVTYYGRGKVIGEFICDGIQEYESEFWDDETFEAIGRVSYDMETGEREVFHFAYNLEDNYVCQKSGLSWEELRQYVGQGIKTFYGWHIFNVTIYDKPKKLSEFYTRCNVPESKCKLCDNCFDREDSHGRHYAVKQLTRPPQSWCKVEG